MSRILLETDRLLLREMMLDDIDALLPIFSDAETMRYYPAPFDREGVRGWVEWNLRNYQSYRHGLWVLVLKQTNEVAGDCGLVVQEVEGAQEIEIGWHIRRDLWGHGLATEAARMCRDYGFTHFGYPKLISLIHPDNTASRRVAEKIGMRLTKEIVRRDKPVCVYTINQ